MPNLAPKIIDDIVNEVYTGDESINSPLPRLFSNKVYLYSITSALSGIIILFTIAINQMSPQFVDQLSMILDRIGFLNLKLSYQFIEDLKLPNPVSILILVSNSAFILYAFTDSFRTKDKPNNNHFKESYAMSYAIHLLFLLVLFISIFIAYQPKPKIKVNTLEFITVQEPTKEKPPPQTKKRSERASIDQGKNNPEKKVEPVKKSPSQTSKPQQKATPKPPSKSPPQPSPAPKPKIRGSTGGASQVADQNPIMAPRARSSNNSPSVAPKSISTDIGAESAKVAEKALSQIPSPSVPGRATDYTPSISKGSSSGGGSSGAGLPAPKNYGYSRSTGGGTGGGSGSGQGGTAAPKAAQDISGGGPSGQDLIDRLGDIQVPDNIDVSFGGGGGYGNPDKNKYPDRAPSTASIPDISFGPYMSKIQERIKQRWRPPKGSESKRIVVFFSINRDGSLSNLKISQTNATSPANDAALNAVRDAAPFPALPVGSPPSIDIEFTFDYNVFKRSRY